MNEIFRKKQKDEAIKRMKKLNIMDEAIRQFKDDNKINVSEGSGIMFWADGETLSDIEIFEKTYNALVYHAIKGKYRMSDGSIMECVDFFYVCEHEEEWARDNDDLENGTAFVYTKSNFSYGDFGYIFFHSMYGGVARIA